MRLVVTFIFIFLAIVPSSAKSLCVCNRTTGEKVFIPANSLIRATYTVCDSLKEQSTGFYTISGKNSVLIGKLSIDLNSVKELTYVTSQRRLIAFVIRVAGWIAFLGLFSGAVYNLTSNVTLGKPAFYKSLLMLIFSLVVLATTLYLYESMLVFDTVFSAQEWIFTIR